MVGDGDVLGWVVLAIDPVRHVRRTGQRLEPVRAAYRHYKSSRGSIPAGRATATSNVRGMYPRWSTWAVGLNTIAPEIRGTGMTSISYSRRNVNAFRVSRRAARIGGSSVLS